MKIIKSQEEFSEQPAKRTDNRNDLEKYYEGSYKHWMTPDEYRKHPQESQARREAKNSLVFKLLSDLEQELRGMAMTLNIHKSEDPEELMDKETNPERYLEELEFVCESLKGEVRKVIGMINSVKDIVREKDSDKFSMYPLDLERRIQLKD